MLFNEAFEVLANGHYPSVADAFSMSAAFSVQWRLSGPFTIYASVLGTAWHTRSAEGLFPKTEEPDYRPAACPGDPPLIAEITWHFAPAVFWERAPITSQQSIDTAEQPSTTN